MTDMPEKKPRNFKESKVDTKAAFKEKSDNDAARKLGEDYKIAIEKLKAAVEEMFEYTKKYATKFDVQDELSKEESTMKPANELKSYLSTFETFDPTYPHFFTINNVETKNLLTSYERNNFQNKVKDAIKELYSFNSLEELKKSIESTITIIDGQANKNFGSHDSCRDHTKDLMKLKKFVSGIDNSAFSTLKHAKEYMKAIDNFLDIYSDILGMDPRNESEKSKGYKEYAAKILKSITPDSVTNTIEKVTTGDVSGLANDAIDTVNGFVSSISKGAVSSFSSFMSYFTTEEDKKFFAGMPTINTDKLTKAILTNEAENDPLAEEIIEEDECELSASDNQVSLPMADLSKSVKLTDINYSNTVHNNNQAEARNMVEIGKAECIEWAALMQKFVIQKCKVVNSLTIPKECEGRNHEADLMMKNCATMFPMETKYDAILNEHLQFVVSEAAIISETGEIIYIGAGAEIYNQPAYVAQITVENVMNDVNSLNVQQILTGVSNATLAFGMPDGQ